jgi:hypothetical protein
MAMSTRPKPARKTTVVLLKDGVGRQDYQLPAGTTLAELLREANVDRNNETISIDGKSVEEFVVLKPGMVVSVVPRPAKQSSVGSWEEGIGMFHGNEAFRELVQAVEKSREAEKDRS